MAKINTSTMETKALPLGQQTSIQFRQKFADAGILLRFTGRWQVAGGTGAGAILSDAVARLIRRVEVRGDNNSRVSVRGLTLAAINRLLERGGYSQDNPASLAAGADETFEYFLRVPFSMPHSSNPHEFGLVTTLVGSPTLTLDVGTAADMVNGAQDGAITVSNLQVEVIEEAIFDAPMPTSRLRIVQTFLDVASAAPGRKHYLDELGAGAELRAVLVEGMSGGDGEVEFAYDNSVVSALALVIDGGYAVERTSFGALRQRNRNTYQLDATETGIGILDSAEDFATGRAQLWNVRTGQRPYLEMDLTPQGAGDNRVWVTLLTAHR